MDETNNLTISHRKKSFEGFLPAIAVQEFSADFLDESSCRSWIIQKLHQGNLSCAHCGAGVKSSALTRFQEGKKIKCHACGSYITVLSGTFLNGAHMNFRSVVLLSFLSGLNLSQKYIADHLGCSPENVRLWNMKFKAVQKVNAMLK